MNLLTYGLYLFVTVDKLPWDDSCISRHNLMFQYSYSPNQSTAKLRFICSRFRTSPQ